MYKGTLAKIYISANLACCHERSSNSRVYLLYIFNGPSPASFVFNLFISSKHYKFLTITAKVTTNYRSLQCEEESVNASDFPAKFAILS